MGVTTVRLAPEVEESLLSMASAMQRSKSWLINQALKEFLARQSQEQKQWVETLKAMDSAAQGQVVSGDAVHAWLNTWGTDAELSVPEKNP